MKRGKLQEPGTASDEKLGVGLGTKLYRSSQSMYTECAKAYPSDFLL